MNNILALLQPIRNSVSKTTLRQMSRIITAMLSMTGRVTMLGLSRWAEKGGSYRTVQRFFHTAIPWATLFWDFFCKHLWDPQETYILAGDESVVTKAGEKTHGLDYFFSGLLKRTVPGLSFFTLSLIGTQRRQSFPVLVRQMVRTTEEKAASQAKKAQKSGERRKKGRPKGSRNKGKAEVTLNPELLRIQEMVKSLLQTMQGAIRLSYLVMDGHFGNHPAVHMVRACGLHLISKLRHDAALYMPYLGPKPKRGPTPRLGEKVNVRQLPDTYLKETEIKDGFETRTYQLPLLLSEFAQPLNIVILLRTNLTTKACSHVILFSSDLELAHDKLIDFYSLRFQIEFNFRDAKQFWGLEDFMNVSEVAVTNAANLSLFMVDISQVLMCEYRQNDPDFSILDLKAHYRGYRYVSETIKMLPQMPDSNLVLQLFSKVAALGRIHPAKLPVSSP
ncbi:MAG TPA: transposase [Anaerolineaceae bacterium]|nr:transposase [Anaerolineaceae bacterium]